jgi:mxaJ protein
LRRLRIGVQTVGEQYVPPAQALARRGMLANLKVFPSTGSERDAVLQSVLDGRLDLAVVWGPEAGYFNRTHGERLSITPVEPEVDIPALPMTFMISMGVRKGNVALRNRLNAFLERDRPQIQRVLRAYGVPLLPIGNLETAQARGGE